RWAKMTATTPPKLIPPFHSTATSGTLPIEQTKLTTATTGPTRGTQIPARTGWSVRKKLPQKRIGIHAASAPVISSPRAMSRGCQPPPERAGGARRPGTAPPAHNHDRTADEL